MDVRIFNPEKCVTSCLSNKNSKRIGDLPLPERLSVLPLLVLLVGVEEGGLCLGLCLALRFAVAAVVLLVEPDLVFAPVDAGQGLLHQPLAPLQLLLALPDALEPLRVRVLEIKGSGQGHNM